MKFWAIEARPGELLADEAIVSEAVSRIVGIATVEALFLFTSRVVLDAFMEDFLPGDESPASRQELEAAFKHELERAGTTVEGSALWLPVFTPEALIKVLETVALDVHYVVLDPDTSEQQVWSMKYFRAYLEERIE